MYFQNKNIKKQVFKLMKELISWIFVCCIDGAYGRFYLLGMNWFLFSVLLGTFLFGLFEKLSGEYLRFFSNYLIVALTIAYIEINNNKFRRLLVI